MKDFLIGLSVGMIFVAVLSRGVAWYRFNYCENFLELPSINANDLPSGNLRLRYDLRAPEKGWQVAEAAQ